MEASPDETPKVIKQKIKLRWPMENDLASVYANQFSYTSTANEVSLVFGSFLPTGFVGHKDEEVQEFFNNTLITPLAKVIMSKQGARALYGLLEKQFGQEAEKK